LAAALVPKAPPVADMCEELMPVPIPPMLPRPTECAATEKHSEPWLTALGRLSALKKNDHLTSRQIVVSMPFAG
jgi:hypothetical protein